MAKRFENFISYRRVGSSLVVKNIYDALFKRGISVFCDVYDLGKCRFDKKLVNIISRCDNFILVLANNTLNRIFEKDDWVRKEIETAIENNVNIICVLVDDFSFPKTLPSSIKTLPSYNGIKFDPFYFDVFISDLIKKYINAETEDEYVSKEEDFIIKNGVLLKYNGKAKTVYIPKGVKTIAKEVFKDFTKIEEIKFNLEIEEIQESAFERCISLRFLHFPASLKTIGKRAFARNYELTNIAFSEGLLNIEAEAFCFCSSLKRVILPLSVNNLSPFSFDMCSLLESIDFDGNSKHFATWEGLLLSRDKKELIRVPEGFTSPELSIPNTVVKIGERALYHCLNIEKVILNKRIEEIGKSAFLNCYKLDTIVLNEKLISLDKDAFNGCISLKNAVFAQHTNPEIKQTLLHIIEHKEQQMESSDLPENILVITTFENEKEARSMAMGLLSNHLVASAQVMPITSLYIWKKQLCDENEIQLQCLTKGEYYKKIEYFINTNHSYELCETICLPFVATTKEFSAWIGDVIKEE